MYRKGLICQLSLVLLLDYAPTVPSIVLTK